MDGIGFVGMCRYPSSDAVTMRSRADTREQRKLRRRVAPARGPSPSASPERLLCGLRVGGRRGVPHEQVRMRLRA